MTKPILISFLENKSLKLKDYSLFINHNDENDWIQIENHSISAYPHVLVKFVHETTQNTFYLFLKNLNIVNNEETILVKTFTNIQFFKEAKNILDFKQVLADTKSKLSKLKTRQYIGLTIDEMLLFEQLKEQLYELKLKQLLNLEERNKYE